jgi:cobalamin biosynthesis protein CobD/CbiB
MNSGFSKLALWVILASGVVCPMLRAQAQATGVLQIQATVLTQEPADAIQAARAELGMTVPRDLQRLSSVSRIRLATIECSGCRSPLVKRLAGEAVRLPVVTVQYFRN